MDKVESFLNKRNGYTYFLSLGSYNPLGLVSLSLKMSD